jgi:acetyl esterase/lipase
MSTLIRLSLSFIVVLASLVAGDSEPKIISGIAYKSGDLTALERQRCVLDLYLPAVSAGTQFPTLVWFHGGGLTEGAWNDAFTSNIAKAYARAGVAVVSVGYRLSPTVTFPAYVEDGAAAFDWVHRHIADHGGDQRTVFLSGHSAGAYLAMMVGFDPRFLKKHELTHDAIAGFVPVAGQTLTHYTVRLERGLPKETIIVDAAAPLHHVRKDTPPVLLLAAERDMAMRVEENQLLLAAFKAAGNPGVSYHLAAGRGHSNIAEWMAKPDDPVAAEVLAFVRRVAAQRGVAAKP